ncbi:MAG: hypothetical protein H6943_03645 [Zoogloeaceae bacterium]|nr:hypothetical protein [Zoogloeaceae bacterium]
MTRYLCAVALCLAMHVAVAGPKEDVIDEQLLLRAMQQISEMNKAELVALTEVLSSCGQLLPLDSGMPRYYCNKELIRYETSGARGPVVGLVQALYKTSRLLLLKDSDKKVPEWGELLKRHVEVYDDLIQIADLRAVELAKTSRR